MAADGGLVAAGRGAGESGRGSELGDVVDRGPHQVEICRHRDPGLPASRSTWASSTTRWLEATAAAAWYTARSASAHGEAPAAEGGDHIVRHRVAGDRVPRADQPARADDRRRAVRPVDGTRPGGACGARTSSPSEPARWATTVVGTGSTSAATSATASSGVATTSRSTPAAAAGTSSPRPSTRRPSSRPGPSAAASDRPARPGPITRTVGPASSPAGSLTAARAAAPGPRPGPPRRRARVRAPARAAARARTGAATAAGGGSRGRARRPSMSVHPEDVDVEGARPPSLAPDPTGGGLQPVAHAEQLPGRQRGVELDDQVEVQALLGPAHRVGLVDVRHGHDAGDRVDRLLEDSGSRSPRFEPKPEKRPGHATPVSVPAPGDAHARGAPAAGARAAAACGRRPSPPRPVRR